MYGQVFDWHTLEGLCANTKDATIASIVVDAGKLKTTV
jgi:hypothetical protein